MKDNQRGSILLTQDALLPGIIKERHLVVGSGAKQGDLVYSDNKGGFTNLGIGSSSNVLTVSGGVPTWQSPFNSSAYGSMYVYNLGSGSTTVTVSLTDTYYQITTGITGGSTNGFTFQNSRELLTATAGTYIIVWSMTVECATASQTMEGAVMVNGTANTTIAGHTNVSTSNKPVVMSSSGILTLAKNDLVSLSVLNHTSANNIVIDHLNLTIFRVF